MESYDDSAVGRIALAEERAWSWMRKRGVGVKFRRNRDVRGVVVSFWSMDLAIAITVGPERAEGADRAMRQMGISVAHLDPEIVIRTPARARAYVKAVVEARLPDSLVLAIREEKDGQSVLRDGKPAKDALAARRSKRGIAEPQSCGVSGKAGGGGSGGVGMEGSAKGAASS